MKCLCALKKSEYTAKKKQKLTIFACFSFFLGPNNTFYYVFDSSNKPVHHKKKRDRRIIFTVHSDY